MNTENIRNIRNLITYAKANLELDGRDEAYAKNRVLEILQGVGDELSEEETDEVFGVLSLLPSRIDERFADVLKNNGSKAATDWLYNYCVKNEYVKKSKLDKNPRFESDGLIITINKAKPEFRDPKKAVQGNSVDGGFAKCVICRENEGYGARNKRNLRTVSITLGGDRSINDSRTCYYCKRKVQPCGHCTQSTASRAGVRRSKLRNYGSVRLGLRKEKSRHSAQLQDVGTGVCAR